ncbi:MAG: 5-formyltetrahydrofolate cyclo-ligase [Myxococcales bacterium]|nr:5-formyltetrahydrofolate cyclo-ligase [Myxococcales bacterium]
MSTPAQPSQVILDSAPPKDSPMADKDTLRSHLKAVRASISEDERAAKSKAASDLALAELSETRCVAVYSAFRSELDPSPLVASLRAQGVAIAFPRVCRPSRVLEFCTIEDDGELAPGALGLLEPIPSLPPLAFHSIDAFVIPALGFDPRGQRLGWGQGHYDHTLAQCPLALRVGICFQEQILASLPCEPTDAQIDIVITDLKRYQGAPRPRGPLSREQT